MKPVAQPLGNPPEDDDLPEEVIQARMIQLIENNDQPTLDDILDDVSEDFFTSVIAVLKDNRTLAQTFTEKYRLAAMRRLRKAAIESFDRQDYSDIMGHYDPSEFVGGIRSDKPWPRE